MRGKVDLVEHLGNLSLVYVTLVSGDQVVAEAPSDTDVRFGQRVSLSVSPGVLHVFGSDGAAVTLHRDEDLVQGAA